MRNARMREVDGLPASISTVKRGACN